MLISKLIYFLMVIPYKFDWEGKLLNIYTEVN